MKVMLKKSISILMSMMVVIVLSTYNVINNVNATSDSRTYRVYNYSTDTEGDSYTLSTNNSSMSTMSIIGGTDERQPYTNSSIVKLSSGGTGFIIGTHTIATAGHCLVSSSGWIKNIKITLFNENNSETEISAKAAHVPELFVTDNNSNYDYALLTVNEDLTSYGTVGLGAVREGIENTSKLVNVAGFPYPRPDVYSPIGLYTSSSVVKSVSTYRISYTADTSGGNSGGPIYVSMNDGTEEYITVIGIHTSGGTQTNSGIRITFPLLKFYKQNTYID